MLFADLSEKVVTEKWTFAIDYATGQLSVQVKHGQPGAFYADMNSIKNSAKQVVKSSAYIPSRLTVSAWELTLSVLESWQ